MDEPLRAEDLFSQKGWVNVGYDRHLWIPCPPEFPPDTNLETYTVTYAKLWWEASGLKYRKRDVTTLASMLAAIHADAWGDLDLHFLHIPCHLALIHLPDPRLIPLPVYFGIWRAWGEREERLRQLTQADEPEAIEPPIVEEFTTGKLGTGLKTLHYRRGPDGSSVHVYLNYAWRSERYETDLRLFTFWDDLGRLQRAIPDIDELARVTEIVPRVK